MALILLFVFVDWNRSAIARGVRSLPAPDELRSDGIREMEWFKATWRRWQDDLFPGRRGAGAPLEPRRTEDWEARLSEEGVSAEWVPPLARRLETLHQEMGRGSALGLIRAAAVAVELQSEARADVERNMRDVKEVERLLGAFSGELEKLDEVLEVLSAYAQRMRSKPVKRPRHTLH